MGNLYCMCVNVADVCMMQPNNCICTCTTHIIIILLLLLLTISPVSAPHVPVMHQCSPSVHRAYEHTAVDHNVGAWVPRVLPWVLP